MEGLQDVFEKGVAVNLLGVDSNAIAIRKSKLPVSFYS